MFLLQILAIFYTNLLQQQNLPKLYC